MAKKTHKKATSRTARQKRTRAMPEDPEILNTEGAARVIGVSSRVLLQMARGGEVPARKVGKEWRFHRPTLRKWIAGDSEVDQLIAAMRQQGRKVRKTKS